jgi:hypothetical protein
MKLDYNTFMPGLPRDQADMLWALVANAMRARVHTDKGEVIMVWDLVHPFQHFLTQAGHPEKNLETLVQTLDGGYFEFPFGTLETWGGMVMSCEVKE